MHKSHKLFCTVIQNAYFFKKPLDNYAFRVYNVNIRRTRRKSRKAGDILNAYMYPNIEAERVRKGLSQDELVKELGYKERKTYYNWLSSGNIPESALIKMADLFECTIDHLLSRRDTTT